MRGTRWTPAGLLATAGLVTACAVFRTPGSGETFPLVVNNRTTFDVVIFAVPYEGARTLTRLGDAHPGATTTLVVATRALQPQNVLQLKIHAIGSARTVRSWLSPAESLDSTLAATLDVRANPNGDLSKSSLYTMPRDLIKKP